MCHGVQIICQGYKGMVRGGWGGGGDGDALLFR